MADPDEAAAIVNALQRHAAVVVQKSLAEGFGLTVAEAMWKARPIVASAVGGIVDQIVDGAHGLLVADPADLASLRHRRRALLRDPTEAARLGANARARAGAEFLGDRHLEQYGQLLARLGEATSPKRLRKTRNPRGVMPQETRGCAPMAARPDPPRLLEKGRGRKRAPAATEGV